MGLRTCGLRARLIDAPGNGRCSRGREGHETPPGHDGIREEWRAAKQKTYPAALRRYSADSTVDPISRIWGHSDDGLQADMGEEDSLWEALLECCVSWDPYRGLDEGRAPDFVPRMASACRADPEIGRFYSPVPPAPSDPSTSQVF